MGDKDERMVEMYAVIIRNIMAHTCDCYNRQLPIATMFYSGLNVWRRT